MTLRKLSAIVSLCLFLGNCGISTEARGFVNDYLKGRVVNCGNFSYAKNKQWLVEMKDFGYKIEPRELNEAGRMNGYEFGGYVHFSFTALRVIGPEDKRCWGTWQTPEGTSVYFPSLLEAIKKNGKWEMQVTWFGKLLDANSAPDCSSVRQILDCPH